MLDNSLTRRRFMGGAAAAAGVTLAGTGCGSANGRPNILWIIAEDFSPDLGCYGEKAVRTPNIDRLASEGVRFERAFVTAPVCSASRSAIVTGMYQTSVGGHNHRSHRDDNYRLPDGILPFTHYFRQAGYHTSNVRTGGGLRGTGKTDFNFNVDNVYDGSDWNERNQGQPFYSQINFSETHRAFHRFPDNPVDPAKLTLPPYYPDHPAAREEWAIYLDTTQHLDVKVGQVLRRLEEEGLAQDTIVFFFSDHGRPMPRGKQFLYEGGIRIPLIVRIPEKFRPEGFTPGSVREDFVSAIDITATSLKLAGVEPPGHMQGQVFLGPGSKTRDYIVAARDRCDETVDRIRCVRTKQFKYIRNYYPDRPYTQPNVYKDTSYPMLQVMRQLQAENRLTPEQAIFMAPKRPAEELYELEADPHELNNLAASPAHTGTLRELSGILDRWIKETGDKGENPENPLPAEYRYRTQVDGWCTRNQCLATKSRSVMKLQCSGKGMDIRRSHVTEGGEFAVEFRARSRDVAPKAFFFGTIDEMGQAASKNRHALDFATDGQWHDLKVNFQADGFLTLLAFDIGDAEGTLEFDWVRLYRRSGGSERLVTQWDFA